MRLNPELGGLVCMMFFFSAEDINLAYDKNALLLTYVHPVEFTVLFESFDPLPLKLKNIFYIIKLTRFFLIPSSDLSETFVLIRFKWTI